MLPKVSVFIATSFDGFIARRDGSIDWLERANATAPPGEDFGYQKLFDSVDTLVMGRKTFEKVLSFDTWPFGEKRVVVLSSKLTDVPDKLTQTVSILNLSPIKILETLAHHGSTHIYLDGGNTVQRFLVENLIDEITVTKIPVLLGDGISLFDKVPNDIPLAHVNTRSFNNGFVQSTYQVVRKDRRSSG